MSALVRWQICRASRFLDCLIWLQPPPAPSRQCLHNASTAGRPPPVTGAPGWRQPRMAPPAPGAAKQGLGELLGRDPGQRWLQAPGESQSGNVRLSQSLCLGISRLHPDTLPKHRAGLEMPGAPWHHPHIHLGLRLVKAVGSAWPHARVPGAAGACPCLPLNFEAGPGSPPQPGAVSSPAAAPWRCAGQTVPILRWHRWRR